MRRVLKNRGGMRVVYDEGETFERPICSECPNLMALIAMKDVLSEEFDDPHLSEADISRLALRNCKKGKTGNPDIPCTLPTMFTLDCNLAGK